MTRGHRGLPTLRCKALSSSSPRRFIPAHACHRPSSTGANCKGVTAVSTVFRQANLQSINFQGANLNGSALATVGGDVPHRRRRSERQQGEHGLSVQGDDASFGGRRRGHGQVDHLPQRRHWKGAVHAGHMDTGEPAGAPRVRRVGDHVVPATMMG